MCGRYTLHGDTDDVRLRMGLADCPPLIPRYNIAPGQEVPVVGQEPDGRRLLRFLRWGLVPPWAKDPRVGFKPINARSETVATKPMFRGALRARRCLLIADGFYEWRRTGGGRVPHYVRLAGGGVFGFAGLWEDWRGAGGEVLATCALLTKEAGGDLAEIHGRMPVVLDDDAAAAWLDPSLRDAGRLGEIACGLPAERFEIRQVATRVNKVANDGPDLIDPVAGAAPPA